jgi:integrase
LGCLTGLRFSDICGLRIQNIDHRDGYSYVTTKSKKTGTGTMVKLPPQALNIIGKYKKNKTALLPTVSLSRFNKNIKKLAELAGWVYAIPLSGIGKANGKQTDVLKNVTRRFCDSLSSHTMRRTCITTMLASGMPDYVVRKISGHTSESKAFFRYVNLAQSLVDKEIEKMHVHFIKPVPVIKTITAEQSLDLQRKKM